MLQSLKTKHYPATETLETLSNRVFSSIFEPHGTEGTKQTIEYQFEPKSQDPDKTNKLNLLVTAVDPAAYLALLQQYAEMTAASMGRNSLWLDDQAPPAEFFEYTTILQRPMPEDLSEHNGRAYYEDLEREFLFVQRAQCASNAQVCFLGDYHGSIHSCLRNLWRLVAQGYLDTNFRIIKDNFHIVALGDYIDRGWFGLEVLYTLLLLKLAPGNWDKVFLLKGNHETIDQCAHYETSTGLLFVAELGRKFGGTRIHRWGYGDAYLQKISIDGTEHEVTHLLLLSTIKWFTLLPEALFISTGNGEYAQCSHGGIDRGYNYELINGTTTTTAPEIVFQHLTAPYNPRPEEGPRDPNNNRVWPVHTGLNWSDFIQTSCYGEEEDEKNDNDECYVGSYRGGGIKPNVRWTTKYMAKRPFLKAFFRGHQDLFYGLKMLFTADALPQKEDFLAQVAAMEKREDFDTVIASFWHGCATDRAADNAASREWRFNKRDKSTMDKADLAAYERQYAEDYKEDYASEYKEQKKRYPTFFSFVEKTGEYDHTQGPFYWKLVVAEADQNRADGFLVQDYFPVFTFSSAPHGRGVYGNLFPFDCYGILQLASTFAQWRLNVYEFRLPNNRHRKYVTLTFAKNQTPLADPINVTWSEKPEAVCVQK